MGKPKNKILNKEEVDNLVDEGLKEQFGFSREFLERVSKPFFLDELVEGLPGALEKLSKLEGEERKVYYRELWEMSEKIMYSWVEEKPN